MFTLRTDSTPRQAKRRVEASCKDAGSQEVEERERF